MVSKKREKGEGKHNWLGVGGARTGPGRAEGSGGSESGSQGVGVKGHDGLYLPGEEPCPSQEEPAFTSVRRPLLFWGHES